MNFTSSRVIGTVNRRRIGTRPNRRFAKLKPRLNQKLKLNQRLKTSRSRKLKLNLSLTTIQNRTPRLSRRQPRKLSLNLKPNLPNLNPKPKPCRRLKPKQSRKQTLKMTPSQPTKLSQNLMPKLKTNLKRMENLRPRRRRSSSNVSMNFTSNWVVRMFVPLRNRIRRSKRLSKWKPKNKPSQTCLLYTSDAADDLLCVDLGGRRI